MPGTDFIACTTSAEWSVTVMEPMLEQNRLYLKWLSIIINSVITHFTPFPQELTIIPFHIHSRVIGNHQHTT